MPLRVEQAQTKRHRFDRQVLELRQRFALHALFDRFAILVHAVQLRGHFPGQVGVGSEQAFDAQAHVIQTPGRVQAWANDKPEIGGGNACSISLGHFKDRFDPRPCAPGANPLKALMHQNPIVGVQRHHVGDAAQRHQVKQFADVRLRLVLVPAKAAQARAQRHQHIENHPDAGERLAREFASGLVRVDQRIGQRQFIAGQVVVGDQYFEASLFGSGHAFDAGDAVVDGDQQLRLAGQCDLDDFRGQAVAIFEAVRHQIVDMRRTEQAQTEHADSAGGRPVRVEVADDEDALALLQRRHQQVYRRIDALELLKRDQPRQALVQLRLGLHAPRRVQAGQQGWQITEKRQSGRQLTRFDTHGVTETSLDYVGLLRW
ncbi:hypothetical protein D3C72_833740 [compost metagenome]